MRAEISARSKHRVVSPSRIVCVSFAAIRFLINDGRESFKQREIQQLFNSLLKRKSFGNYSANSFSGKIGTKQKCELELGVSVVKGGGGEGFIHCWLWTERFFTAALDRRRFPITRFQTIKFDLSATDEVKEFYYY